MKLKKIELLAPAGTKQALIAAVAAGADAVYLGMTVFSARAFADNFTHAQTEEAIRYCHDCGVKVYVTMNTLLYETELDCALEEVRFLYDADVDALLIQDFGLFMKVRSRFPSLAIHCSTQMHIHNVEGCRFMAAQGAKRVVLARETPIELIAACVATGIEIEVFCYGAQCISYSGQCLLSSCVKKRSGNRGLCAQMCRLPYKYFHDGQFVSYEKGNYLLSPKDLNLLDRVPTLIKTGVSSLKIEGRMKRPEYVYGVVSVFRQAIDRAYEKKSFHLSEAEEEKLLLLFNRGFSQAHVFHTPLAGRMAYDRPNHRGIAIGSVIKGEKGRVLVQLTHALDQNDGLRILQSPDDVGLIAQRLEKDGKRIAHAQVGDRVWISCPGDVHIQSGRPLLLTTSAALMKEIRRRMLVPRRRAVTVFYEARKGQPLRLTATLDRRQVAVQSEQCLSSALKQPLSLQRLADILSRSDQYPFVVTIDPSSVLEKVFMPIAQLNATRRALFAALTEAVREKRKRPAPIVPSLPLLQPSFPPFRLIVSGSSHPDGIENGILYVDLEKNAPVIQETPLRKEEEEKQRETPVEFCMQAGDLSKAKKNFIAGMTLNVTNSAAVAWLLGLGAQGVIVSGELSEEQVAALIRNFEKTYDFTPPLFRLVYGRRNLMYIKDRFLQEETKAIKDAEDRIYPLRYTPQITKILEPVPYSSANHHCYGSLILFTDETAKEQETILRNVYEKMDK